MRILVIGGSGKIGSAVVKALSHKHEVLIAGRKESLSVDISSEDSIEKMFTQVGAFDACIVAVGGVQFAHFEQMDSSKYIFSINNKLMGQINIVLHGSKYINEKGSFTLTSGVINKDPPPTSSAAAMVNGGIDSFVKAVALELPKKVRINAVSPTILDSSVQIHGGIFAGYYPITAEKAAFAYVKSVEGNQTGQLYEVY